MMVRVGLLGAPPPEWASLRRTYDCYRRALSRDFDLRLLGTASDASGLSLDVLIGFWGSQIWDSAPVPAVPRMVCLHGGAVVNYPTLPSLLSRLTDRDVILCNCSSDVAVLHSLLPRPPRPRSVVLSLPVAPGLNPRPRTAARSALGLPPDALVLGFVGRLIAQKGLHYFLRTLAHCRRLLPARVHGLVVGDFWAGYGLLNFLGDRYRDYVVGQMVRDGLVEAVTFRSSAEDDDVLADYYAAMDLLVHPTTSVDENFGYVPLEALACGRPVVACAYGGLKDTVAEVHETASVPTWSTSAGLRFDLAGLREHTVRLLGDEHLRDDVVVSGQKLVATRYSFTAFADDLSRAVREAVRWHREGGPPVPAQANHPPMPPTVSHLPRTSPDWTALRPAVDHFVSRSISSAGDDGVAVYSWPDLERRRNGDCLIHDPAWPGTVPLSADAWRALDDTRSFPRPMRRSLLESGVLAWSERSDAA